MMGLNIGDIILDTDGNKFIIIFKEECEDSYYTYYYMISLSKYENIDKNKQYEYSDLKSIKYLTYNELIEEEYTLIGHVKKPIKSKRVWTFE